MPSPEHLVEPLRSFFYEIQRLAGPTTSVRAEFSPDDGRLSFYLSAPDAWVFDVCMSWDEDWLSYSWHADTVSFIDCQDSDQWRDVPLGRIPKLFGQILSQLRKGTFVREEDPTLPPSTPFH